MNMFIPIIRRCKLYFWKLFHSFANRLFDSLIKSKLDINKNCHIFIKQFGYHNTFLVNHICCSSVFFKKMDIRLLKWVFHLDRKIPSIYIDSLDIYPNIVFPISNIGIFKLWEGIHSASSSKMNSIDEVLYALYEIGTIKINTITITINAFRLKLQTVQYIRNGDKSRCYIKSCRLFYNDHYVGKCVGLKINYSNNHFVSLG